MSRSANWEEKRNILRDALLFSLKGMDVIYDEKVELASGGTSDYYVDVKKAYGNGKILGDIAECVYYSMRAEPTCIASNGIGGYPLASVICSSFGKGNCLVRDKSKGHGKKETFPCLDGYIPGKDDRVYIVDDVFTTGKSLRKVLEKVVPTEAKILGAIVVVKRGRGDLSDAGILLEHVFTVDEFL